MEDNNNNQERAQRKTSSQRKLSSVELLNIFKSEMDTSETFEFIGEEKNPCHVMFEGIEFYVYIKNLSSAYFDNEDVSRAQLTGVDSLLEIKKTESLFILLGYDADNHVFAAWNPHVAKQRIGTASSPSLYSRFSWQKEAKNQGSFIIRELKNDGSVLIFPQENISLFFGNIEMFFPDTSEYVAMGSKRRSEANSAYRELTNTHNMDDFGKFLNTSGYDLQSVQEHIKTIKKLINSSLITKNRKVFLACDSLLEYRDAVNVFLSIEEIKILDAKMDNAISYALPVYINFLIEEYGEPEDFSDDDMEYKTDELQYPLTDVSQKEKNSEGCPEYKNADFESMFIDEHGNLTCIANPKLIDLLREDLCVEYPSLTGAYATIEDFYGDRFPNMEMHHWNVLFKKIDWNNPYSPLDGNCQSIQRRKTIRQKIRVVKQDGQEICEKQVVKTLLEVIKYAGVDAVRNLNITMGKNGGTPLITTDVNNKYANAFKELGNGYYVNTCSDTIMKYQQIEQINNDLGLGLTVELI